MNDISNETKKFGQLLPSIKDEVVLWKGDSAVGLSVLRDYPDNGKFIPIRTNSGKNDSVALIRIGYLNEESTSSDKRELRVSVNKASRYLLNGNIDFIFGKQNDDSPSEASVKESRKSKQPVDLTDDSRYEINLQTKRIWDKEKKEITDLKKIVDSIYESHLKTLTHRAFFFRLQLWSKELTVNMIDPANKLLKYLNFKFFGRTLRKSDNFALGIFEAYSLSDLIDSTTEKTKVFGSDFPITNQSARTIVILTLSLFLINYYFNYDILGLVNLTDAAKDNLLFQLSIVGGVVFVVDGVIPYAILLIINALIKTSVFLMKLKIKFS